MLRIVVRCPEQGFCLSLELTLARAPDTLIPAVWHMPHDTLVAQVGAVVNMSALLMKQMLEDAEQQGAALTFDTSTVEDQGELPSLPSTALQTSDRSRSRLPSRWTVIDHGLDRHSRT